MRYIQLQSIGYPYKTPAELNVENKYDAYIATKQAIYCVLYDYDVENVYRGVDERGENIKKAIKKIVKKAKEETQTQEAPLIKFNKEGKLVEDSINKAYYSQTYSVTSNVSMKSYTITSIANFTKNTIITDMNSKEKENFKGKEKFKVLIPKKEVSNESDINGTIYATMKCETYPVFYGKKNSKLQPYALTYDTYGDNLAKTNLKVKMNTGKIQISKVDDETKTPIEGVTFQLIKPNGTIVAEATTNKEGIATFSNLYEGKYQLKEIKANQNYIINTKIFEVEVVYDKTTKVEIGNKLKKGQVKVIKVDAEQPEIKLKDVEFNVLDKNGNILETLKTDENGEAITKEYAMKDFEEITLQETKTQKSYVINETLQTIKLKANEIINVTVPNKKIKGQIEITKISADENKLTKETKGSLLKDAIFEIYTQEDILVDTVKIGTNGKGISKLLEYGKYYIKEKSTGSNYYLLNTEKYSVEIKEDRKIVPITIENKSVDIRLDIDKSGVEKAKPNEEIKYEFNTLKNTSNVAINDFTWTDFLPYQYVRMMKLYTGTYNENLDYIVKYKTNKSKKYMEYGKYNTQKNNCIDFTKVNLKKGEYITEYKVEFGTVMPGFEAIQKPYIFVKVLPTVKEKDRWINHTTLTGKYKDKKVEDKAEWPTTSYEEKLPRTGF